jgi:hypothetical protein
MRILITITPLMYRQALALYIRRKRPEHELVIASPETAVEEIAAFEPHMLLHNDNDEIGSEAVADILYRITVLYTDGMDARINMRGHIREAQDMSSDDLVRILDSVGDITG